MIIGKEPLFGSMELYVCISEAESLRVKYVFQICFSSDDTYRNRKFHGR